MTDEAFKELKEDIKFQIDYNIAVEPNLLKQMETTIETIDLIVDIMMEIYNSNDKSSYVIINGQSLPRRAVQEQYKKITFEHIEFILSTLHEAQKNNKIKNIRAYLRTCLYNAPHTLEIKTQADVYYDMAIKNRF